MKFKNIVILFIIFLFSSTTYANSPKGYKIEVNAPFEEGSVAYLAGYWEDKTYIIDSISVPKGGSFTFENPKSTLQTGQYLLYVKPNTQIDFLLEDRQQNVKMKLDIQNLMNSSVEGSNDTKLFWQYLKELNSFNSSVSKKLDELNATQPETDDRKEAIKAYTEALKKTQELTEQYLEKYKNTWFADFIKASSPVLEPYLVPENREQVIANHRYSTAHYLDNIDFQDMRLWNTNILIPNVKYYLKEIVSQHPDSLAEATSKIVSLTRNNPIAFEKTLSYFVNDATTSLVMGMENVWAKLAEDYIFDKEISWIDEATYNQLKADYSLIELNRLGMKAQDLALRTIDGDSINTNEIEANYTLLYFYSPSCSFCREEIPLLRDSFYETYKSKGLEIIAINLEHNLDSWKNFIEENKMQDWHNVFDPNYTSEYWLKYNVSGTPSLFLLSKDKTILAKKLNVENLTKYLERLIK